MPLFTPPELDKLHLASKLLLEAEDRLPVLGSVAWEPEIAQEFFAKGAKELPRPVYTPIDPTPSLEKVEAARKLITGDTPVHDWLNRFCDMTETTAVMLASLGTKDFLEHSRTLYGGPNTPIADEQHTALDLALRLDDLLSEFDDADMRSEPPELLTADDLKREFDAALPEYFGDEVPEVIVTPHVSAKAVAGRDYIKLRADAHFSDLDVSSLLQHEALIHIATGKNGAHQTHFPILAESHPANARTQEGLAVFSEHISASLGPRRFRRLANRTIAINMSIEGADFLDLYQFFREQNEKDSPFEAFESARRVVRGGLVEGGAPFTKDSVYLGGLVEVHSYLRAAVVHGEVDLIKLLFVGKMDLQDLTAIQLLKNDGLIEEPRILPPWASDMRFLLSYLSYSTFLNQIDQKKVSQRYSDLFATI